MNTIKQFFIVIALAAFICSIIKKIVFTKTANGKIVSLACGAFMALCVLNPLIDFNIEKTLHKFSIPDIDATTYIEEGENAAANQMQTIITEQAQAYILDKAASLGLDIEVIVELDAKTDLPKHITLVGDVSPYDKTIISRYIENTLAITEDNQMWKS